jgi:hypothetical protein
MTAALTRTMASVKTAGPARPPSQTKTAFVPMVRIVQTVAHVVSVIIIWGMVVLVFFNVHAVQILFVCLLIERQISTSHPFCSCNTFSPSFASTTDIAEDDLNLEALGRTYSALLAASNFARRLQFPSFQISIAE